MIKITPLFENLLLELSPIEIYNKYYDNIRPVSIEEILL
jgi:hypothetical protein